MNYELACLVERLLFSGAFLLPGAFSIQVITAPSASHAAQMGSSPQPTTGPGLPQVLLGCVGSTGPLPASQPLAAPKARTISCTRDPATDPRAPPDAVARLSPAEPGEPGDQHCDSQQYPYRRCQRAHRDDHPGLPIPLREPEHSVGAHVAARLRGHGIGVTSPASSYRHPQKRKPPDPATDPQASYDHCRRAPE